MINHSDSQSRISKMDKELFDFITSNINDTIAIHGPNGECRYISPSVHNILGYSSEEIVGTICFDYYHPDDVARIGRILASAREEQPVTATRCEYRCRRKDGSYCWLESEISRIIDTAGKPAELLAISRDITARKQVEQKLMNSYDRLALVLDRAKAGVWGFEPAGGRNAAFRQWWSILGYAEGEVESTREGWLSLCHPGDREMIEEAIDDYLAGRRDKFEFAYRVLHKNGSYRWIWANANMIPVPRGNGPSWMGLIIDINDLKELEAAQRESEMRLRSFVRAISDVSAILDESGRYVEVFAQNKKLLSRSCAELKGRSLYQGLMARNADFLIEKIQQTIKTRRLQAFSVEAIGMGGKRFVEVKMAPMNYRDNGKKTVAVVFTDISEKRRAEKLVEFTLALRRRSSFINEVISEAITGAAAAIGAKALGIDLSGSLFCYIVHLKDDCSVGDTADSFEKRQSRIFELLSEECGLFVWDCRSDIGVLVNAGEKDEPAVDMQLAERILGVIELIKKTHFHVLTETEQEMPAGSEALMI